jgi:hypothetical protein
MDAGARAAAARSQTANDPEILQPASWLALALLVPGVGADHTNDALAANDLAILAKLLN